MDAKGFIIQEEIDSAGAGVQVNPACVFAGSKRLFIPVRIIKPEGNIIAQAYIAQQQAKVAGTRGSISLIGRSAL